MPSELEELHTYFKKLFEGEEENIILASMRDPIKSTVSMAEFGLDMGLMYAYKYGIPDEVKELCEPNRPKAAS